MRHAPSIVVAPETREATLSAWRICAHPPGTILHPDQLVSQSSEWIVASSPGTVGAALKEAGQWDYESPCDIDSQDWWWRTTFRRPDSSNSSELVFSGLATLAEVWLNGRLLFTADNMFREYRVPVDADLLDENELVLGFRSLTAALQAKRPRPRWKTNLVSHQQLRWFRTTLLGHIPGWSPPLSTVGPWRPVRLESSPVRLIESRITARFIDGEGRVEFHGHVRSDSPITKAVLCVGDAQALLQMTTSAGEQSEIIHGKLVISDPELWWPHTHGPQSRYDTRVKIATANESIEFPLPEIGFRSLEIDDVDGGFGLRINREPVYCRGACWTVSDLFTLDGSEEQLRLDLKRACDAGVNMLRVGGTMIYESETFLRLCDEFGILVWQDFPFANMDYPVEDPAFLENITAEVRGQIIRQAAHPSLAIYCGGSEVEQQAAMLGMPPEMWTNDWFSTQLPGIVQELAGQTIYLRGSPTGGSLPFSLRQGVSHFYGIGAYRRPLAELRSADVRFTSECLGFANLPEPRMISEIMAGGNLVIHDPRWKRRTPRDTGAGWDFEDIRDHYLREIYNVDPVDLRSVDPGRYLQLSRTVPGEMMSRTFAEWRRMGSRNRGGLVWFYKDLWPGAGWGILDSEGAPKAAYYYLRRSWQLRNVFITDEGLNGLDVHVVNETAYALDATLQLTLLKQPNVMITQVERSIALSDRDAIVFDANELLGRFYDVNHAYRFGPAAHDVVIATLLDDERRVLSQASYLLRRENPRPIPTPGIETEFLQVDTRTYRLELKSDSFLQAVRLSAKGLLPDDNYFHLPPGHSKVVHFQVSSPAAATVRVELEALNVDGVKTIPLQRPPVSNEVTP